MNVKNNIISSLFLSSLFFPVLIFAQVTVPNPLSVNSFGDLLFKIAGGISTIIGSIAVIMIIYAGILYLISAGDPGRMGKAKTTFLYAVIGIIIAGAATAIVTIIKDTLGVK